MIGDTRSAELIPLAAERALIAFRRRLTTGAVLILALSGCGREVQWPWKFYRFDVAPESVSWSNGHIKLRGVVVSPTTKGRHPAVVLVHGAGKATHDEPALIAHANAFLARGFAVLLYDKRGSGASTGDVQLADYSDLAADLGAGVRMLRDRSDIDPDRIGLLGRSEGGWVAPLAAMQDPRIAFVIMSSGSAVPPIEQNLYWIAGRVHSHGGTEAQVVAAQHARRRLWEFYRDVSSGARVAASSTALRDSIAADLAEVSPLLPEMGKRVWTPEGEGMAVIRAVANQQFYEPMVALRSMHAPVLAVLGEKEDVVQPASTLAALDLLRREGHRVDTQVFPGVGHSLMRTVFFVPQYAAGYLQLVTSWAADIANPIPPRQSK